MAGGSLEVQLGRCRDEYELVKRDSSMWASGSGGGWAVMVADRAEGSHRLSVWLLAINTGVVSWIGWLRGRVPRLLGHSGHAVPWWCRVSVLTPVGSRISTGSGSSGYCRGCKESDCRCGFL